MARLTSAAEQPQSERPISGPRATAPQQGGSVVTQEKKEKTVFDRVWDSLTIYKNDESNFFNEFRFVGRFHLDSYQLDSELGHDQDTLVRRWRMGGKACFFHNLDAHAEVEFDPHNDTPLYRRLTDAYLVWKFSEAAN